MVIVKPRRSFDRWSPLIIWTTHRGTAIGRVVGLVVISCYVYSLFSMHEVAKSDVPHENAPKDKAAAAVTVAIAPQDVERALQIIHREKQTVKQTTAKPKPPVEIVDTTSWAKPSAQYEIHPTDLWESEDNTKLLPLWMKQYFRWHKEQTTIHSWSSDSWKLANNYLFVTCLAEYNKCGGTADRLLGLPFFLKVAASTNRVLLIHWSKPALLEEYLLPPSQGIDWRVQRGMEGILEHDGVKAGTQDSILQYAVLANVTVLQTKFQSHDHGSVYYDSRRESLQERDFDTVFAAVWRIIFTPSPALAEEIQRTLERDNLRPGQYTSAHVRALYQTNTRDTALIQSWSVNAIRCAVQLQRGSVRDQSSLPVFFASDSDIAVGQAIYFSKKHMVHVVSQPAYDHGENVLHLDKTPDWKDRPAKDFFGIFIDLYVLSLAKCVTYGMGGFGKLASLMSSNVTCSLVHMTATSSEPCVVPASILRRRHSGIEDELHMEHVSYSEATSIFLPPMHGHNNMNERRIIVHPNEHLNDVPEEEPPRRRIIIAHNQEEELPTRRIIVAHNQDEGLSADVVPQEDPQPPPRKIIVVHHEGIQPDISTNQ